MMNATAPPLPGPRHRLEEDGRKAFLLLLCTLALGPPLTDWLRFGAWLVSALVIGSGQTRKPSRLVLSVVLVALVVSVRALLPAADLQEGHNYFLPTAAPTVRAGIPLPVYQTLEEAFTAQYPPESWCERSQAGCWRAYDPPAVPYAFSADSVFRRRKFSRVVDSVDFAELSELRAGFVNRTVTNWFDTGSDVTRQHMPFFAMYELSRASVGSTLCWRGKVLWEEPNGSWTSAPSADERCRHIAEQDVGRRVFGISVHRGDELAMRFHPSRRLRIAGQVGLVLSLGAAAAVLLASVRPHVRRLAVWMASAGAAALATGPDLVPFGRYEVLQGGSDGIPYHSFADSILQSVEQGAVGEALKGVEPVFFFMPGLRYFRALEKLVFGDTGFAYLTAVLLLPLVLFALLRLVVPWPLVVLLLLLYFSPEVELARAFSWHLGPYVSLARMGLAEPLGYTLFLGGCIPLLGLDGVPEAKRRAFWGGLLMALSVITRPNLALAAALLLSFTALTLLRRRERQVLAFLCLGFLPFFWMPLHNLVYGGRFVLTSSAGPITLITPPGAYLEAAREMILSGSAGIETQRVRVHLAQWIGPWYRGAALLVCLVGLARPRSCRRLRGLTIALIGLHAVLLFWIPIGRYALLAWQITLVAAVAHLTAAAAFTYSRLRARGLRPLAVSRSLASRPLVWALLAGIGIALEASARLYAPMARRRWGDRLILPTNVHQTLQNPANPKLEPVIVSRRNSLGFRGPELPREFDRRLAILAMGDGTTECGLLSDGKDWPSLLAGLLQETFEGVWVNNAGEDSLSTFGQQVLIDRMAHRLRPKVVLLLLGANEIGRERPTARDLSLSVPSLLNVSARESAIVSEVLALATDAREGVAPRRELDLGSLPRLGASHGSAQALVERHRRLYAPVYRRRVRELLLACRRAGLEPVLMTQPALYGGEIDDVTGVSLRWIEVDPGQRSHGGLAWRILEEYNDVVRAEGAAEGVLVIDLARRLPKSSRLYYDFAHFTGEGARQVAEIAARELCPFLAARFPDHVTGPCGGR